jgi:HlyD family secretion protein
MARILKVFAIFLVLAGVTVGGYAWLQNGKDDDGGFEKFPVTRGSITEKAVAIGQIEPRLKFHVKSKISGIVKRTAVEVGDSVNAGDPLFEIVPDPTPSELVEAQMRLDTSRSAFERAQADWSRSSELSRQGIISSDQLDARKERFALASIEMVAAQDNLDLTQQGRIVGKGARMESTIRAPAGGILLERKVDPGDPVVPLTSFQEGTELATIADMSDLIFKGTVDEIDVGKLKIGAVARLKIGALPGQEVTGRLSRIAPQAKEEEGARLFEVEIEIDPVNDLVLRAGYSANADLIITEKTEILLAPERLIHFEDDGARKFVELPGPTPESEPVKVEVETGLSDGLNIEIISGLEEGQEIIQRPPRDILG